jgi:basic membrane lipoprotein Med (substrate-binding protein (PBP1-ABC) superfamily)
LGFVTTRFATARTRTASGGESRTGHVGVGGDARAGRRRRRLRWGEEGTGTTTAPSSNVRVALVTDIGGLNDQGFNALANRGLKAAEQRLGVEGRVFISDAATD